VEGIEGRSTAVRGGVAGFASKRKPVTDLFFAENLVFRPFLGILRAMTPEEHRMLEETRALAEENSNILKSIQRMHRTSLALKLVYWVVIIGTTIGAFYFIQPYIDALKSAASENAQETGNPYADLLKGL
jgi:hypothetical protein